MPLVPHIPKEIIVILSILFIGCWFMVDEKSSVFEKISFIFVIAFVYVAFRMMTGASFHDVISPLFNL